MKKLIVLIVGLLIGISSMAQEQIDFKVDIPEHWKMVTFAEEENLWVYESSDENHRLTVSVLYYSEEPTHIQQRQFLGDFLNTRQGQSSKIARDIKFSETETKEYQTAWVAKYSEFSSNGRIATTKSISSKVGIANFYLESFSTEDVHENISKTILSTTGFSS